MIAGDRLVELAEELCPRLQLQSVNPFEPVVVRHTPEPWQVLGVGNYAAVLVHPEVPDWVVKIYAPGRPGLAEEGEVYRRLGSHSAYSQCHYHGERFLILRRLAGITLYDCLRQGIPIPPQVIDDVDAALAYAVNRGLTPCDVHGKNVVVHEGRGYVADISDFGKGKRCRKWDDLKRAYLRLYRPFLLRRPVPVPEAILTLIRRGYRLFRRAVPTDLQSM